ncbi:MAG: asparagine--tRNA ligase [Desulforegulaceae bacterium]|nr:asparagine--tRNA ligase [Desulforegulaceae bacterium]
MKRIKIKEFIETDHPPEKVFIGGWIRTKRDSKAFSFIELNDGSCLSNIQVIADSSLEKYERIGKLTTGSSISVFGKVVRSPGKGQKWEVQAEKIKFHNIAPDDFPLQKKRHSDEFLRSIAHLRPRTNKFGAVFRIRSEISQAVHSFFYKKGFNYIHTPIITASDCEGAGDMFSVSSDALKNGSFFSKPVYLTVSGQLEAEMMALSLGDVYTFGPTFRAENSNTSRHAAEFWMIEPEMAFCDLEQNMDLAEEFIKNIIIQTRKNCSEDLELFNKFVDKTLFQTLENILENRFLRISYSEAVEILKKSGKKFQYEPIYGADLQTEHERFITETEFKKPVFVYDYPKTIKPFYMRINNDNKTVAAMDLLVPKIGELIGGSQREERYEFLLKRMEECSINKEEYWWYLDSRKYGSVYHSGFGVGFERLIMLITGISNIRDVIPFPRTPGSIDF